MSQPTLSLCLITRNEARNLPACLASVRGLVDEIIVVDTGSTDETVTLARAAGAVVHEMPWPGDFSVARNAAIERATGRWILVLDADETLPSASHAAVARLVAAPPRCAYTLVQRSNLAAGAHLDVAIVRLFPRDERVRFERPIHEQVNTSLERCRIPIEDTGIIFDHTGYADATAMPAKTQRNRALIESALHAAAAGPAKARDPHLRYFYANTFFDAGDFARAAREYLECAVECGDERPRLRAAARIKAAEAFFLAGEPALALDALPDERAVAAHPQASVMKGEIMLGLPDQAYMPPVVVAPLKLKALELLAGAWAAMERKEIAVGVLQLGMAFAQGKISHDATILQKRYVACRAHPGRRAA